MRINKNIIRQARQANLVAYLESKGYSFTKQGNRYRCMEHNSLLITNCNAYFWNSKQDHGNSIDFLVKHLNMDFKTAVQELTNTNLEHKKTLDQLPHTNQGFTAPEPAESFARAFAYLNKSRCISNNIITQLIKNKQIIQTKQHNNIAFLIADEKNTIVGAELQGTLTYKKFKGIAANSKYGYGFNIQIKEPKKAFFFESAVDLLSFYQLCKNNILNVPLNSSILVSMAGLKVNTLCNTLTAFKIHSEPYICVDNDTAGANFRKSLRHQGIAFKNTEIPNNFKDWNEYLKYVERA